MPLWLRGRFPIASMTLNYPINLTVKLDWASERGGGEEVEKEGKRGGNVRNEVKSSKYFLTINVLEHCKNDQHFLGLQIIPFITFFCICILNRYKCKLKVVK
jgi:hypothetical protein